MLCPGLQHKEAAFISGDCVFHPSRMPFFLLHVFSRLTSSLEKPLGLNLFAVFIPLHGTEHCYTGVIIVYVSDIFAPFATVGSS